MSTKIALLPEERVVMRSDKDILTLTTRRVRYDSSVLGGSSFISITLDSVASCSFHTKSLPLLLVLGAVALIGAFTQYGGTRLALFGIAVVLVITYFITRRSIISIGSNGGQAIHVPAGGMNRASVVEFLEAIESEKLIGINSHRDLNRSSL